MEENQKELQLLPTAPPPASSSTIPSWPLDSSVNFRSTGTDPFGGPSLDLQLSVRAIRPPSNCVLVKPLSDYTSAKHDSGGVKSLKWQATEQIRLATAEKAYMERLRELTRREMELAQAEFKRARHMWERAREEVDNAERMKERATCPIDEITCPSCRQKFQP